MSELIKSIRAASEAFVAATSQGSYAPAYGPSQQVIQALCDALSASGVTEHGMHREVLGSIVSHVQVGSFPADDRRSLGACEDMERNCAVGEAIAAYVLVAIVGSLPQVTRDARVYLQTLLSAIEDAQ